MELLGGTERVCVICGKEYWSRAGHAYNKIKDGVTVSLCSYGCMQKWKAENEQKPRGKGIGDKKDEIIRLVKDGLTAAEIGRRLNVAPGTIRYHMVKIQMNGGLPDDL